MIMNKSDYEVDVTKRVKWHEVNNDKVHNYYYLVYVRIYNADRTRYRKAKFVVWLDAQDVAEWADNEDNTYTDDDVIGLLEENIWCVCDLIKSYDDTDEFYDYCRQTIKRFNSVYAA